MRLENLRNLPVFNKLSNDFIGKVEKVVIDDNYKLAFVVIEMNDSSRKMLTKENFELSEDAILIENLDGMKSYLHGEDLSIYHKKIGDLVFDQNGKEIGYISDFILSLQQSEIYGIEVSTGLIKDLLDGREEVPINKVCWNSEKGITIMD